MCYAWQLDIKSTAGAPPLSIVAKRVELPAVCSSIGDQRKKDSYDVEASFYSRGHAERLIAAGAVVPFPPMLTRTSQSLRHNSYSYPLILLVLYVRVTRASLGRAVRTTYRGTTGSRCMWSTGLERA